MSLKNPVQYPVKYYNWQDDKAPQLSDNDGVIKTILKACLVTGYGSKAGAGWTSVFEDDYRIVLRRPLRTGNPPDIKIENGVINGTASHRIVAQDNPTSVDDTNELSAVNLFSRDPYAGKEWHCIVTDFAFILYYQMGFANSSVPRGYLLFIGGAKKFQDNENERFFLTNDNQTNKNGQGNGSDFLNSQLMNLKNARDNTTYTHNYFNLSVAEKYFNNDYLAQKIITGFVAELPFYCAIPTNAIHESASEVSINNRRMLRCTNVSIYTPTPRAFYIPLDYWEL